MTNKIKETKNYELVVKESSSADVFKSYHIINKNYGVIEVETTVLPQALKFLDDLEASLAALEDMSNDSNYNMPIYSGRSRLTS